tara:strand:- start:6128 stop:6598 length:471 start_codon:yes stop_codon:yes gene_type:complete
MKFLAILYLFFSVAVLYAQDSSDAVKHLGAGIVVGGIGGYAAQKISNGQRGWTWAGAVGSSLVAGLAKETLYDQPRGASWESRDVIFTTLGGVVSALALEVFTGHNGNRGRNGGYGKNCGCLVAQFNLNEEVELPNFKENGSGDIASELQATYLLR